MKTNTKSVRKSKFKYPFNVGKIVTTNDGNMCEDEVAIKRIAECSLGIYSESADHEEFLLAIRTPNLEDNDKDFPEYLTCIKLSRGNLLGLQGLLEGMDLSSDLPFTTYGDFE